MKELGRVTFSPDTTSGGGSPRASLERRVSLERKIVLLNMKRKKKKNKKKKKKADRSARAGRSAAGLGQARAC